MRCLFCKQDSSGAKSVEHIVPESLGNKTLILPQGYVCDKCNNYFAREVEKPFLERLDMRLLRFYESVPSKKKKIPHIEGIVDNTVVRVQKELVGDKIVTHVDMPPQLFQKMQDSTGTFELMIPALNESIVPEQGCVTSRFLAKMALEALAERLKGASDAQDYLVDDPQLDLIRNHARLGTTKEWPCSIRRIYHTDARWKFCDHTKKSEQIIYECDFLLPKSTGMASNEIKCAEYIEDELYFVIALWGIEFAINIGGPDIDGYQEWLHKHGNVSPLHFGKNEGIGTRID